MERFIGLFGLAAIIGSCYLLSNNRRAIKWRVVVTGLLLQLVLAVLVLKTGIGRAFFDSIDSVFATIMKFSDEASTFLFGKLVTGTVAGENIGTVFAFKVLPSIIVYSAIMALLYHVGIMHRIVYGMPWLMKYVMGTSGAESLAAAANIFVGQTEAPLVIKPFLAKMTRSELLTIMVGGMANIAGGVMAAYVAMLSTKFPDIAGHLVAASIMSAPASLLIPKILIPETDETETGGSIELKYEPVDANLCDAVARGASEGLQLAFNVGAMLIAFLAVIALGNHLWGLGCSGVSQLTGWNLTGIDSVQEILGHCLSPVAYAIGIPWSDCTVAGQLLGEKIILNEFVAYAHMGDYLNGKQFVGDAPVHELTDRTKVILSYALCGFANIGSIGIIIGGMGGLVPSRRKDIAKLGVLALIGGSLATFMTAAIAGLLI